MRSLKEANVGWTRGTNGRRTVDEDSGCTQCGG